MDWKNKLYFGDNFGILRAHVATESVDLIYLDPPFNANASYNFSVAAIYDRRPPANEKSRRSQTAATASGEESAAQIAAFADAWQWGRESEAVYRDIVTVGPRKCAAPMRARGM
ncbi:MAG: modification methylase [Acidobacteria bacterium]|nr:modification methylase [Acidobacteriota bacterium]